jgi:hypothetical protein
MIFKFKIGRWRLTVTFAPVIEVVGVNSCLPDGKHIIMWDFDEEPLPAITWVLKKQQEKHRLPTIYVLNTGLPKHYIAYCFKKCTFQYAVAIVASTPFVDWNFFKWGVFRGRFTLRVGPKCGRIPKLVAVLKSREYEDAKVPELQSWVKYETLSDEYIPNVFILEVP